MPGYFMYYSGIYGWGRGSRVQVAGCRFQGAGAGFGDS